MNDDITLPLLILVILPLWIIACWAVARGWESKGLSFGVGFTCSFFLSPLMGALIGILTQPEKVEGGEKVEEKNIVFCPYCGTKTAREVEQCGKCGSDFTKIFEPSEYECETCGSDVPEDAKYCPKCGEKLED